MSLTPGRDQLRLTVSCKQLTDSLATQGNKHHLRNNRYHRIGMPFQVRTPSIQSQTLWILSYGGHISQADYIDQWDLVPRGTETTVAGRSTFCW